VFQADDVGYNAARGSTIEVDSEHETAALLGIDSCPEAAIRRIA
jgi:ferredoxin